VLAGAPYLRHCWAPTRCPERWACLDVVRLLRITTDSPAVEATSTRCQAVLEAFRGRDAAARRMIDSARRTVTEPRLRHALLEVEQFAGIVELVLDDPAAAEPRLRQAYNGFRRMGLMPIPPRPLRYSVAPVWHFNREAEADELCTESERLAGQCIEAAIRLAYRFGLNCFRAETITTRPAASPRPPSPWPSAPTRWSITATPVCHWQWVGRRRRPRGGASRRPNARPACMSGKALRPLAERARRVLANVSRQLTRLLPKCPLSRLAPAAVQGGRTRDGRDCSRGLGRIRADVRTRGLCRESAEDRRL